MIKIHDPRLYANCIRMYERQYYYFRMICVDEIIRTSPFASFYLTLIFGKAVGFRLPTKWWKRCEMIPDVITIVSWSMSGRSLISIHVHIWFHRNERLNFNDEIIIMASIFTRGNIWFSFTVFIFNIGENLL